MHYVAQLVYPDLHPLVRYLVPYPIYYPVAWRYILDLHPVYIYIKYLIYYP